MQSTNDIEITMEQAILNDQLLAVKAGFINVHHYDVTTGEYLASTEEYLAIGVGIPAHTCLETPPATAEDTIACWQNDSWQAIADHRGLTLYNITNGEEFKVTELGELPTGYTTLAPSSPFDQWDDGQWVLDLTAQQTHFEAQANQQKSQLITQANQTIQPLQDAADLAIATTDELTQLAAWKTYRVLLNRLDITNAPELDWPTAPTV